MVKIAILLLALTMSVTKFANRWMPEEAKKAARVITWLLAAYVLVSLGLGVIAYLRPAG